MKWRKAKIRFSVRSLVVSAVIMSAVLGLSGLSIDAVKKHNRANNFLRKHGAIQLDGYEDPIGPNWMYGLSPDSLPDNGYFPNWFSNWFCLKGFNDCSIDDIDEDSEVWNHLGSLMGLKQLVISNCRLPEGWLSKIRNRTAKRLYFEATVLSAKDIRALAQFPNLELLSVNGTVVQRDCLIEALVGSQHLKFLFLTNTGLTRKDKLEFQDYLPDCEIQIKTNE